MWLIELWKKDQKTFWKELKLFLAWLVTWPVRLSKPVVNYKRLKKTERSLIGNSYYFIRPRSHKVRSPFEGKVVRIYPNYTIHLINQYGLQVIVNLEFDKNNPLSVFDVVKCSVKENQKVQANTTLFLVFFPSKILWIAVLLPWQPWLIGKVQELPTFIGKDFASIYYRNPLNKKINIKRHREYHY